MRKHGGMTVSYARRRFPAGFRISGHGGAMIYFTSVYPPADSGYLVASDMDSNWPAGCQVSREKLCSREGANHAGKVIDVDSKQPVAGAAVFFQPKPDNPNNRNYDLRNTVVTDTEGRFAITTLPGAGFPRRRNPGRELHASSIRAEATGLRFSRRVSHQLNTPRKEN